MGNIRYPIRWDILCCTKNILSIIHFLSHNFPTTRHSNPIIHCLMTHKDEELYTTVVLKIQELLSQLQPTNIMSDWERASRKAFKHAYSKREYMDAGSITHKQFGNVSKKLDWPNSNFLYIGIHQN